MDYKVDVNSEELLFFSEELLRVSENMAATLPNSKQDLVTLGEKHKDVVYDDLREKMLAFFKLTDITCHKLKEISLYTKSIHKVIEKYLHISPNYSNIAKVRNIVELEDLRLNISYYTEVSIQLIKEFKKKEAVCLDIIWSKKKEIARDLKNAYADSKNRLMEFKHCRANNSYNDCIGSLVLLQEAKITFFKHKKRLTDAETLINTLPILQEAFDTTAGFYKKEVIDRNINALRLLDVIIKNLRNYQNISVKVETEIVETEIVETEIVETKTVETKTVETEKNGEFYTYYQNDKQNLLVSDRKAANNNMDMHKPSIDSERLIHDHYFKKDGKYYMQITTNYYKREHKRLKDNYEVNKDSLSEEQKIEIQRKIKEIKEMRDKSHLLGEDRLVTTPAKIALLDKLFEEHKQLFDSK